MTQIRVVEGKLSEVGADLDLSREGLAQRMGVSPSTAYRIDVERVPVGTKFIGRLLAVSGRPFEELFEVSEDVPA